MRAALQKLLTKLATLDPECRIEELIAWAVSAINSMDKVRNRSPLEHAMGVSGMPAPGDPFAGIDVDIGETQEQRRLLARKSYLVCEYAERGRHAEQSRNRAHKIWNPRDLVHSWRAGKGREKRPGKKVGWYGPSSLGAVETAREMDGSTTPQSSGSPAGAR